MYVLFYACVMTGFVVWLEKKFIYMRSDWKCEFAYDTCEVDS